MLLGNNTQIVIGTNSLKQSFYFYQSLGFDIVLSDEEAEIPWMQISDWSIAIMLSQDNQEYFALTYFSDDMDRVAFELDVKGVEFVKKVEKNGVFIQGVLITPDNFGISIINYKYKDMFQPEGAKLIDISPFEVNKLAMYPNVKCGVFGEISQPVKDLKISVAYWAKLGFEAVLIYNDPYPTAIMTDGVNIIGLHQTTFFKRPAITYFAPDMKRKILTLKSEGIDFTDFSGKGYNSQNVMTKSPENQRFFLITAQLPS